MNKKRFWISTLLAWLVFIGIDFLLHAGLLENLWKKGVPESRSVLFPNWADMELIYPLQGPSPMRRELGIPSDTVVALYSGNMGQKQGLEILIDVARKLKSNAEIQLVLCGEGVDSSRIKSMASDLANVICIPLQPTEKLNDLLNLADIHLLPQRSDVADLVMPSRLTGILASGKPVVATAHLGTEVDFVVKSRGIVVTPGDADAFADALLWLVKQPKERQRLGEAGRDFAVEKMSKKRILSQFENLLIELIVGDVGNPD